MVNKEKKNPASWIVKKHANKVSNARKNRAKSKNKNDDQELQEAIKNLNHKVARINNSNLYKKMAIEMFMKITIIAILIASIIITIVNFAPSIISFLIKILFKN
jgi:hypothetical protein